MPELPEIHVLARDMRKELAGRTVSDVTVLQPKCLNVPVEEFKIALTGARILDTTARGKWLLTETTQGWMLTNLGMGGEVLLVDHNSLPEKFRLAIGFQDGSCLAINFWWFGHVHYVKDLADHRMVSSLGPDFLDVTLDDFRRLLHGRRGGIKSFLLDQRRIAGIGNVYVQDPLFKSGLHPLRRINTLSEQEVGDLWRAVRETLLESIDLDGSQWEQTLDGSYGRWDSTHLLVAYREGKPCPVCGTPIEKIRTGSTSTHICPRCQSEAAAS